MDIKKILKKYNLTLNDLASKLFLSRPTLNLYISQFEKGGEFSNKKYFPIFNSLFTNEWSNESAFKTELEKCHSILQIKKNSDSDLELSDFTNENLFLFKSITSNIYNDLKNNNKINLYKFLNSVISNYDKDEFLQAHIDYFLCLNGLKQISDISKTTANLISNIYPLAKKLKDNQLQFNEEGLNLLKKRILEIEKQRNLDQENLKKQINQQLNEAISEKIALGIKLEDINIEEILKNIKMKK